MDDSIVIKSDPPILSYMTRSLHTQSGPNKYAVALRVVTSSVMDQFTEIPLLESLLNFQKDACNICHVSSKCYRFTLQNGKQVIMYINVLKINAQ